MKYRIEYRNPTTEEYQAIRATTGWDMLDNKSVKRSLKSSLFGICILEGSKLVGIGRVVGDGGIYFYVQDIIVIPEYQGKGIGKLIMDEVESFLKRSAPKNAFIGLMSARGVMGFYERFGYQPRPQEGQGMYKIKKG